MAFCRFTVLLLLLVTSATGEQLLAVQTEASLSQDRGSDNRLLSGTDAAVKTAYPPSGDDGAASASLEEGAASDAISFPSPSRGTAEPIAVTGPSATTVSGVRSGGGRRRAAPSVRPSRKGATSIIGASATDGSTPVSDKAVIGTTQPRRRISKKPKCVVRHELEENGEDGESATPKTDDAQIMENRSESKIENDEELTENGSEASINVSSVTKFPRRQVKRRNKSVQGSSAQPKRTSSTPADARRVIRRRERIPGVPRSNTSATSPAASATNDNNPLQRRRVIGQKQSPSAESGSSSSPSLKRRGRRPLSNVSALEKSSREVASAQPLIVRTARVARHDGSDATASSNGPAKRNIIRDGSDATASNGPAKRNIIRRRARVGNGASAPAVGSTVQSSSGAKDAPQITRRRVVVRSQSDLSTSSAASPRSSDGQARNGSVSPRRKVQARGKARRRPAEEGASLSDFSQDNVSLVKPLDFRPRIARARAAFAGLGVHTILSSQSSGSAPQQATRRRAIKRRREQNVVKIVTDSVSHEVVTIAPQSEKTTTAAQQAVTTAIPPQTTSVTQLHEAEVTSEIQPDSTAPESQSVVTVKFGPVAPIKLRSAATTTAGPMESNDKNLGDRAPTIAKITRKIIRWRRPSTSSNLAPTVAPTTPGASDVITDSTEEPEVTTTTTTTTQRPSSSTEPSTSDESISFATKMPITVGPRMAKSLEMQRRVGLKPVLSKESAIQTTTDVSSEIAASSLSSVGQVQRRRYQTIASDYPSISTTGKPVPARGIRDSSSSSSLAKEKFAKADLGSAPPPRQISQPSAIAPSHSEITGLQKHPEAETNDNGIVNLQSTLPAGGGTVVGERPVSQFRSVVFQLPVRI